MNLPLGARLWIADAPKDPKGMILICPGGGYQWLSPREAQPVARAFAAAGWAAAVVYYTIREKPGQSPLGTLPVRQLGEALQTMQQRFPALSALVCGFSAGGHLAASLGVHWRELGLPRPDGMILGCPVITAGKYAHCGSIQNLAGSTIRAGIRWKRRSRQIRRLPSSGIPSPTRKCRCRTACFWQAH